MNNVEQSTYLRMSPVERVHYLAEAHRGSAKKHFQSEHGQTLLFFRPAVRQVIVDATLYTDRKTAVQRASAVLERIKSKSKQLSSNKDH